MRARTDLWEPWGGNAPGPPGPAEVLGREKRRVGATRRALERPRSPMATRGATDAGSGSDHASGVTRVAIRWIALFGFIRFHH